MKAIGLMAAGVSLLHLDTWVLQTNWLAVIGLLLMILSVFLTYKEEP